jgi:hypothetical protein
MEFRSLVAGLENTMKSELPPKYTMTISRTTVDKLGIKLYDKVSAVLAELIANAYDADAEVVKVSLPVGCYLARRAKGQTVDQGYVIEVMDDGHGMTAKEVNEFYLRVGIDRRKRPKNGSESREKKRPVMGRKGIGKLAPFGICREVEVISAAGSKGQDNYPVSHLILRYDEINNETDEAYHPQVGPRDGTTSKERGTTIVLRGFERRRVPEEGVLQRQLTARFGLARTDWDVKVSDSTGATGGFSLGSGELEVDVLEGTRIELDDRPVIVRVQEDDTGTGAVTERKLPVSGWVAYAKEPYKDDVMAGVRIYARGKIVSQTRDFDIPSGFTGEYKLRSYLTGFIQAEWLDEEEDMIRSDRQDIAWNNEVGEAFRKWGQDLLRELAQGAENSVKNKAWDDFLDRSNFKAQVARAFPRNADFRARADEVARLAIRGADREALRDPDYLSRVVTFAMSVAPHRAILENLRDIAQDSSKTLDTVIEVFGKVGIAEIYSLWEVAKERVDCVRLLQKLISTATTERPLQELLERAPWLMASDWTPILMDRSLETFRRNFEAWYERQYGKPISTTTIDRAAREPDFIFVNLPKSLEIVEIKKPEHALTDTEFERAHTYLEAVRAFLEANPEIAARFPEVQLTIVCSSIGCRNGVHQRLLKTDKSIRHRPWETILQQTLEAHDDFLKAFEEAQRLGNPDPNGRTAK